MSRFISISLLVLFLGLIPALAFAAVGDNIQETASFKMTLRVGAVETMLMPDQAKGATAGEVMAQMPGMPMPSMSMTDLGHPVNHHLEVQIVNKANGHVVTDQLPVITVTDQKTGASRPLTAVMAMYGVTAGQSDWHFGNNIFLADGTYTITVALGSETATFKNVTVGAPANAGAATTPSGLPKTGGLPLLPGALALGIALVAGGGVLRRSLIRLA